MNYSRFLGLLGCTVLLLASQLWVGPQGTGGEGKPMPGTAIAQASQDTDPCLYVCAQTGSDDQPGTQDSPLRTLQKAADLAAPGTVIRVFPGVYVEQVLVSRSGTWEKPIVFESILWRGAVMTDRACCFKQVGNASYITIRGFWFRDCPLADGGLFQTQVIVPSTGWRVEDCRFTRCGVGLGYDRRATDTSYTAVVRCVFEDMAATASWAWASQGQRMKGHLLQDTIFRRCNGINNDPAWQGQGAKYGYTQDLMVDGLICYDNNGPGLWLDWNNDGFTVQNGTFFGNHAGWAYANFTDQSLSNTWWIGDGIVSECNGSGLIQNNVVYSNLGAGIAVWESGHLGGVTVRGNLLVENGINLELRAMGRKDFGDPAWIEGVKVLGNQFKGWKYGCWMTASLDHTLKGKAKPADARCEFEGNTYQITASSLNGLYGKWLAQWTKSLGEMREVFGVELGGEEGEIPFAATLTPVHDTQLEDAGTRNMWQVPSGAAEANDFETVLRTAQVGDLITLPVTGRKAIQEDRGRWRTTLYDLSMRQATLWMDGEGKAWVQERVNAYASIDQQPVKIRITQLEPYAVQGEYVPQEGR
ncbi:MAG: right-handed parallel beta-helix repeat-containing protein [Candidatus Limiplasma sp.]|nr:right-handed parallel beta-helix repeat-containing protein [Candidatus Limiplasma sp.]